MINLLKLSRFQKASDGIVSLLETEDDKTVSVTMEHAYPDGKGGWEPKIGPGTYTLVRFKSPHFGYDTFQIHGVAGHTGLEFHPGNTELDSEGCVLTGEALAVIGGMKMVTHAQAAFKKFMALLEGQDSCTLVVS